MIVHIANSNDSYYLLQHRAVWFIVRLKDMGVSWRRALNLVYNLSNRDAEITDYLFWWKSYRMKSDARHYWLHMLKSPETAKGDNGTTRSAAVGRWCLSTRPHMCTKVASYQEPSEIPEEIQINKTQKPYWKPNTFTYNKTCTANRQQIVAVTPVPTKITHSLFLAK